MLLPDRENIRTRDAGKWSERNPAALPPRQWVYGRHYLIGAVSATVGDGGVGKTTLSLTEAIAIATGRPLLGTKPATWQDHMEEDPLRWDVLYWNGEEPREEIERRVFAICQEHKIDLGDLDGRLTVLSGVDDYPLTIARSAKGEVIVDEAVVEALAEIEADVMIFDPLVSCHRVSENDNGAVDAVVKAFGRIAAGAVGFRKSVELVHHSRKSMQSEGDTKRVADARGASAFIDGVRSARVLNKMTESEAARAGVKAEERWRYIRADNGKANYAAPSENAAWHRLASAILPNGDDVGVVVPWQFPGAWDGVTAIHMERVRDLARGGQYRADPRSPDWIGNAVADVLSLEVDQDKGRIKEILAGWYESGALRKEQRKGPDRHPAMYVDAGDFEGGDGVRESEN